MEEIDLGNGHIILGQERVVAYTHAGASLKVYLEGGHTLQTDDEERIEEFLSNLKLKSTGPYYRSTIEYGPGEETQDPEEASEVAKASTGAVDDSEEGVDEEEKKSDEAVHGSEGSQQETE